MSCLRVNSLNLSVLLPLQAAMLWLQHLDYHTQLFDQYLGLGGDGVFTAPLVPPLAL